MTETSAIQRPPLTLGEYAQLHREYMQEIEPLVRHEVRIRCLFFSPRFVINRATGELEVSPEVIPDWAKPLLEWIDREKQQILDRYVERAAR